MAPLFIPMIVFLRLTDILSRHYFDTICSLLFRSFSYISHKLIPFSPCVCFSPLHTAVWPGVQNAGDPPDSALPVFPLTPPHTAGSRSNKNLGVLLEVHLRQRFGESVCSIS